MKPSKSSMSVLSQICKFIPPYLVSKLSKKHGIDKQARSFSPWSHLVSMLHCHLAHSLSLNDVVDTLRNQAASLFKVRQALPPSRNGLSHANKIRDANMAEELFWETLASLTKKYPEFRKGHKYSGLPHRFTRGIYAIDSSTINLVANCMDWAKHRRRKAAAKCHLRLDLKSFLPAFAIVKAANTHDSTEAKELCADLKDGEIALFDKAYVDFAHLQHLNSRGVFWVTRAKDNMSYQVVGQHTPPKGNIISDELILLSGPKTKKQYPVFFRLVTADVAIDGKIKQMQFITNNQAWAANSICELYKSRWGIEVFFKQIKQTLQLNNFLGQSENAIRWQIWTALLCYLLLRFISFLAQWKGSFSRLFTLLRGVLFQNREIFSLLKSCGTAPVIPKAKPPPNQALLPGF